MDLTGLRALVTGSGSANGIGFAVAHSLKNAGASVAITSLSDRVLARGKELAVPAFACDLTQEAGVLQLINDVADSLGGIDILVNNAGMTSATNANANESKSLSQLSLSEWHASLARNLDSAFLTTKYALEYLRQSKNGRVIFISSTTGPVQAMRNDAGYASAKAALVGLARSIAVDEAPITANVIAPGWIATDSQTAHEANQGLKIPLRRAGRPAEIAGAAAWLASPDAAFITGQLIVIDGGNSIAEERE